MLRPDHGLRALAIACALAATGAARADVGAQPFVGWQQAGARGAAKHAQRGSMVDASTLPKGRLAVLTTAGFPFLTVETGYGVSDAWDLRLGVDSLYGSMSAVRAQTRFRFYGERSGFSAAARLDAAYVFTRPDGTIAALTTARNVRVVPAMLASVRTAAHATFFVSLGLGIDLDLHPVAPPLGGTPPVAAVTWSLPMRVGMELPIGRHLAFVTVLGIDMPVASDTTGIPGTLPYFALGLDLAG